MFTRYRLAGARTKLLHQIGRAGVAWIYPPDGQPYLAVRYRQFYAVAAVLPDLPTAFGELRHKAGTNRAQEGDLLSYTHLGAKEFAELLLKLLVDALRAADEAHAGAAVTPLLQRVVRGLFHRRMLGETEVIVRAKIQHLAPIGEPDAHTLRRRDEPLALPSPRSTDAVELPLHMTLKIAVHRRYDCQSRITFPLMPDCITSKPFANSV